MYLMSRPKPRKPIMICSRPTGKQESFSCLFFLQRSVGLEGDAIGHGLERTQLAPPWHPETAGPLSLKSRIKTVIRHLFLFRRRQRMLWKKQEKRLAEHMSFRWRSATKNEQNTIGKAATEVGLAFQIQDDILDVTSTLEVLGKPIGSDEKNHKATYVSFEGLEKAKEDVALYTNSAVARMDSLVVKNEFLNELLLYLISREK
jgi:hypothetical protein